MSKQRVKKSVITDIVILVLAAVALAVSMPYSLDIELSLGLAYYEEISGDDDADDKGGVYASAFGDGKLSVHFVDVGQGDCTIIQFPDGKTMIVDGAENKETHEKQIQTFIDENLPAEFKYFDYAILTHPDSDHCGSLDYVLQKYPARVSYRPNVEARNANDGNYVDPGKADLSDDALYKTTIAYRVCIDAMYAPNDDFTPTVLVTDPADESQTITGGTGDDAYSYTFYSPLSSKYGTVSSVDWNEYSPIMILEYRGFKFALSGDAEKKNEAEFVKRVNDAKTDGITDKYDAFTDEYSVNVVKAGHHGSRTSTSQAYLDVITTENGARSAYYIISCGEENKYGHPHTETLARLEAMGVPQENILRTDVAGDITLTVETDEGGAYALRYGDRKTDGGEDSGDGDNGDNDSESDDSENANEGDKRLVYKSICGVELKWAVVAWIGYAALVVVAVVHMAIVVMTDGRRGGGAKSGGRPGR